MTSSDEAEKILGIAPNAKPREIDEAQLPYMRRHSMRHYLKGAELRRACPDRWKEQLLRLMGLDEKVRVIRELISAAD